MSSNRVVGNAGGFPAGGAAAAGLTAATAPSVNYTIDLAIQNLYSTSANDVVKSLNFLLVKTSDDANSIQIEQHPNLLTAISDLLDVINPLGNLIFERQSGNQGTDEDMLLDEIFDCVDTKHLNWQHLLGCNNEEFKFLAQYMDDNPLLLTLLGVLRNLSVEIMNEIFIAYHTSIMRHLVSIVEASFLIGRMLESTQLALEVLIFIGGRLEITGSKRVYSSSSYFLEEAPTDPVGRALLRLRMTPAMSSATSELYEKILSELLQVLYLMINHDLTPSRICVIKGLELLSKMVQSSENKNYFSRVPAEVMQSLFRLLYVQVTRAEKLVPEIYALMGDPLGRSRPPYVPAITNVQGDNVTTFFYDQVDIELRDAALNEMRTLCQISKANGMHLLPLRNAVDLLFQIANFRGIGSTAAVVIRNECSNKALAILSVLSSIPAFAPKFQALRTEIIAAGCSDHTVADLMCNGLLDLMFPAIPPRVVIPTMPL